MPSLAENVLTECEEAGKIDDESKKQLNKSGAGRTSIQEIGSITNYFF